MALARCARFVLMIKKRLYLLSAVLAQVSMSTSSVFVAAEI